MWSLCWLGIWNFFIEMPRVWKVMVNEFAKFLAVLTVVGGLGVLAVFLTTFAESHNESIVSLALLVMILVPPVLFLLVHIKRVKEDQRLAVIRASGKTEIRGPGLVFLFPLLDRGYRIELSVHVPEWQVLSNTEVDSRVRHLVLNERNLERLSSHLKNERQ